MVVPCRRASLPCNRQGAYLDEGHSHRDVRPDTAAESGARHRVSRPQKPQLHLLQAIQLGPRRAEDIGIAPQRLRSLFENGPKQPKRQLDSIHLIFAPPDAVPHTRNRMNGPVPQSYRQVCCGILGLITLVQAIIPNASGRCPSCPCVQFAPSTRFRRIQEMND